MLIKEVSDVVEVEYVDVHIGRNSDVQHIKAGGGGRREGTMSST